MVGLVLDFTRLMLISTQVEVGVGVELGKNNGKIATPGFFQKGHSKTLYQALVYCGL